MTDNDFILKKPIQKYVNINEVDIDEMAFIQRDMDKLNELRNQLTMEMLFARDNHSTKFKLKKKLLDKYDEKLKIMREKLDKLYFELE